MASKITGIVSQNQPVEEVSDKATHRKCVHHSYSYAYNDNVKKYQEIVSNNKAINDVSMDSTINIIVVFHFLAPINTFKKSDVESRANDIIASINDDFNNYSRNQNTMNNLKYKSVINKVFMGNTTKQNIYLDPEHIDSIPSTPSNIVFELGHVYYYPVASRLNLSAYDDVKEVEIEHQAVKTFIRNNKAVAIDPERCLNIWIVDMTDTAILGFSNFPWETHDDFHGVVIHRRCFFPKNYNETCFDSFKTFTHEIGHYLGLLHTFNNDSSMGKYASVNLNHVSAENSGDYIADTPFQLSPTYDPMDKMNNKRLHTDPKYNPLFMNVMDYSYDRYIVMFTNNQIQKMRYMIYTYRKQLDSNGNKSFLPSPKYNPETNSFYGKTVGNNQFRTLAPQSTARSITEPPKKQINPPLPVPNINRYNVPTSPPSVPLNPQQPVPNTSPQISYPQRTPPPFIPQRFSNQNQQNIPIQRNQPLGGLKQPVNPVIDRPVVPQNNVSKVETGQGNQFISQSSRLGKTQERSFTNQLLSSHQPTITPQVIQKQSNIPMPPRKIYTRTKPVN